MFDGHPATTSIQSRWIRSREGRRPHRKVAHFVGEPCRWSKEDLIRLITERRQTRAMKMHCTTRLLLLHLTGSIPVLILLDGYSSYSSSSPTRSGLHLCPHRTNERTIQTLPDSAPSKVHVGIRTSLGAHTAMSDSHDSVIVIFIRDSPAATTHHELLIAEQCVAQTNTNRALYLGMRTNGPLGVSARADATTEWVWW